MPQQSGEGLPVKLFIEPSEAQLDPGQTLRLTPTLTDINGAVQTPVHPFAFRSLNPTLLSVDETGLCTTSGDTTVTPGRVDVQVSYPFANRTSGDTIEAEAVVYVRPQ